MVSYFAKFSTKSYLIEADKYYLSSIFKSISEDLLQCKDNYTLIGKKCYKVCLYVYLEIVFNESLDLEKFKFFFIFMHRCLFHSFHYYC